MTLWSVKNFSKWDHDSFSLVTLILGKEVDVVIDEGLVFIIDIYYGNPAPYFRYVKVITINMRNWPILRWKECLDTPHP